jgi:hypothetical protein
MFIRGLALMNVRLKTYRQKPESLNETPFSDGLSTRITFVGRTVRQTPFPAAAAVCRTASVKAKSALAALVAAVGKR